MTELDNLRSKLFKIDEELINILYKRLSLIHKIWEIKKKENIPIFQLQIFLKRLAKLMALARSKWMKADFIHKIYNFIHKESLKVQK